MALHLWWPHFPFWDHNPQCMAKHPGTMLGMVGGGKVTELSSSSLETSGEVSGSQKMEVFWKGAQIHP